MKNVKIQQRESDFGFEMTFEKALEWVGMMKAFQGMEKAEIEQMVKGGTVVTTNVIMFFPKQ